MLLSIIDQDELDTVFGGCKCTCKQPEAAKASEPADAKAATTPAPAGGAAGATNPCQSFLAFLQALLPMLGGGAAAPAAPAK